MTTNGSFIESPGKTKRPVKTALHQAVLDHRLHQVRLIVTKHEDDVDVQDVFGRTPLMLASLLDNDEDGYRMVKIFLRAGAFVNIRDTMNRSALHYACMKGKEEIVRRFLKSETADLIAPDNDGNTPLIHAALSGNPAVVRLVVECLRQFGVDIDSRNALGYTALLLACKYGHYVSAHILVTEGSASPALRDNEFFLNALEWTHTSSDLETVFGQRRYSTAARDVPRFSREHTLYSGPNTPMCHHSKAPSHPLGKSLDTALRLPSVFNYATNKDEELKLKGEDAQEILTRELVDLLNSPKYRPVSKKGKRGMGLMYPGLRSPNKRPTTAKLGSMLTGNRANMYPNMRTLLDMYSEQYADNTLIKKAGDSGSTSANRLVIIHPPMSAVRDFAEVAVVEPAPKTAKKKKSVSIK